MVDMYLGASELITVSHCSITNVDRVTELLSGFEEWLNAGADPEGISTWDGLQRRLTWAPTMQLRDQLLYVEDMALKKRRKKHISADAFHHRVQHHVKQSVPRSHITRAWLLQHALESHLDNLAEILARANLSDVVTKSVRSLRNSVDKDTTLRMVESARDADFAHELVDSMHDFVSEYRERSGRLAISAKLEQHDVDRVQHMVDEVTKWLQGGVVALQKLQKSGTPWRCGHGDKHAQDRCLSRRWNAVFARGARVWRLLDIFDADDVSALKSMVLCGTPLDMLLDEVRF